MRLAVISHKVCWPSAHSPSGFATDGGFAFQMKAISELFDETCLVLPVEPHGRSEGEVGLSGHNVSVTRLGIPTGRDLGRKLRLLAWLTSNLPIIVREIKRADAVHTPIPGDIGTIGLLVALILQKPLFVRHCGNWFVRRTAAEHFWRWLLERTGGDRTVVFATGGAQAPPSERNPSLRWIFATSLSESELKEHGAVRTAPSADGPRLIIASRQEKAKGTATVIESLQLLESEFPGISFDVVGDGGALADFRKVAERCHVAHRVRFHGQLAHRGVMALLRGADLFCFPTTSSEGFPKAVLEALACGVPVVSTRVSVLPELVGAGGGVLLDEATPLEVARGVRWCLSNSARYQELSSAAVRTAAQYSLERWRNTIASSLTPVWGPLSSANA